MDYKFPVKNKFQARTVTELDFDIATQNDDVYVDMDKVQQANYIEDIKFCLNIDKDGVMSECSDTFVKIIFSGHRGSGKTLELLRFHKDIDKPSKYFSVFIEIEKELEVGSFQPYDIFVLLITKLIEKIDEKDIDFKSDYLDKIRDEWFSDSEVIKELNNNFHVDVTSEASIEASISFFLKLKSSIRAVFSSESKTSEIIRRKIKQNPTKLIDKFNSVLTDLRKTLKSFNFNEILFILDGTEKIPYSIYKQLFVKDSYLIRTINVNMIFSVPINSNSEPVSNY